MSEFERIPLAEAMAFATQKKRSDVDQERDSHRKLRAALQRALSETWDMPEEDLASLTDMCVASIDDEDISSWPPPDDLIRIEMGPEGPRLIDWPQSPSST